MIRILGCQLHDDGTIVIEWMDEDNHKPESSTIVQTSITMKGQQDWPHVGNYATELRQDLEELIAWVEKYRLGKVPGQR
jgi:hypothetical protein